MNLLEFAVQRKLEHEDQLLDYVAKHKAVPVDVLSTALADIIGPLEDRRASLLVKNYTEMLSEYVPMTYRRDAQTGDYTVGGEIDEVILDSISLVHDIDAESAISDMIEENIRILTNTPAEVHGLDMGELERVATKLNTQTIQTMSDDELFDMVEDAVEDVVEEAPESTIEDMVEEAPESTVEDIVEEAVQKIPEPTVEDVVEEAPESTVEEIAEAVAEAAMAAVEDVPEPDTETVEDEVVPEDEAVPEDVIGEVVEDDLAPEDVIDEAVEDEQVVAPEDVIDEAVEDELAPEDEPVPDDEPIEDEQVVAPEVMTEEDEEQLVANKMKRIYMRLVEDIKSAGLDKSLGLVL